MVILDKRIHERSYDACSCTAYRPPRKKSDTAASFRSNSPPFFQKGQETLTESKPEGSVHIVPNSSTRCDTETRF